MPSSKAVYLQLPKKTSDLVGAHATLREKARAKINLTLHVGPVQSDGYHPLQSLVVFADIGDDLIAKSTEGRNGSGLEINGPFANGLEKDETNLVRRAARIVDPENHSNLRFELTKNLPIASGIGGGSADAAAAIRLLCRDQNKSVENFYEPAMKLGADIPVCLQSKTCVMSGRGETIDPLPSKENLHAILVNPGVGVSTGKVFEEFDRSPCDLWNSSKIVTDISLLEIAINGRDDLQAAAIFLCPEIQFVLTAIEEQDGCQLARMSGSGATCFGIFPNERTAHRAARTISEKHRHWWNVATVLGDTG